MPPVVPNPDAIKSFVSAAAFERWMRRHHDRADEIWIRVYKKGTEIPSIAIHEALEVALCWGWIDGIRKSLDAESYLQRYTPRRARSLWSQVNREHVARLTAAGRMTEFGQREVDKAKADGRWDAAYAPMRNATIETIPNDLRSAIEASPRACRALKELKRRELFLLAFRVHHMKTAAGRARKIAELVATLERGRPDLEPEG